MESKLMSTYNRIPIGFKRGLGPWLWDELGNQYLDAIGGIAVCSLGHGHPEIARALGDQAGRLLHTSNLYRIPLQEQLADNLKRLSGLDRVFFCNSGAEANETAIKIARRFGHAKGIEKPAIVVMEGAFHGRTLATLSASAGRKIQAGFEPLVAGFLRVPYDDVVAVTTLAERASNIVAVLVEPVQGEGGVNVPSRGYLRDLRRVCDQHGWLLMLDEVQSGLCRTGRWFAFQHEEIRPDVVTLAKALGNGVPIGACMASGAAAESLAPGSHGTTFGGNPLAARAALTVLEIMERDELAKRAVELGLRIQEYLKEALDGERGVVNVRGLGLMIGVELDRPCADLVGMCVDEGLLINVTAERVVRLLPPLVITDDEANQIVDGVVQQVRGFVRDEKAG
jgi:acetylornithine/N-succinyldiaminopimelate aminotransferase